MNNESKLPHLGHRILEGSFNVMGSLRLLSYCLSLLLFISSVNAQPTESTNADEAMFPDVPFISLKGVQDITPSNSIPQYPFDARRKEICGEVVVAVKIGIDGSVMDAKITKSEPPNVFDNAVMKVISKWRYKRVTFNGEPVVYQTKSPIKFSIVPDGSKCSPNSNL